MNSLLLLFALAPSADPIVAADVVLVNGKVWTVDAAQPQAQGIAVWHGRILKVGTDAEIKALAGPKTHVIDLNGRRVVPGFYDSHLHLFGGGSSLAQVNLKDAKDEAEFGRRLREFDRKIPRDRWIIGGNWDHDRAFGGVLPTATIVDKYVKDRPVFIRRYDGHMALANTAALKLAGITAATNDPPGGVVYRLADGKTPSGVLKDNAMSLVGRLVPEPGDEEVAEAILAAQAHAVEFGITSVQDMEGNSPATRRRVFRTLQRLARDNRLSIRVDLRWPIGLYREVAGLGAEANFGSDWVRIGGVKGFMDGSLGSSTAKMFAPYEGEPKNTGVWVTQPDVMRGLIRGADAAGLNVCVHAIGDAANATLLDLYADAIKVNGSRQRCFRIEHAQHLRPQEYARFKELGVVASMQPFHIIDDGRWAEGRIGVKRCSSSYALRSLLDAQATLAFGSDWPVATLDPLAGIDAAVNRRTLDGKHAGGWFPAQRITVQEAIAGYTIGSAYAAGQENDRGSITVGKLADFVVLSRDILDPSLQNHIADTKVELTVVGGQVRYHK